MHSTTAQRDPGPEGVDGGGLLVGAEVGGERVDVVAAGAGGEDGGDDHAEQRRRDQPSQA